MMAERGTFPIVVKTVSGLEETLAAELRGLGFEDATIGRRHVSLAGGPECLYKLNLRSRLAVRVLRLIDSFQAENEKDLYDGIGAIDWSQWLDGAGTLTIDPVVANSFLRHSLFAAQLAKDAIVDQFRSRQGRRPSVNRADPDLRVNLHLVNNKAQVYLDSSGDSLHKRGWRVAKGEAPLKPTLAAGLLALAGWDAAEPLLDPMTGSGTIAVEAALLARRIAPGSLKRRFGFERWPDFDPSLWRRLLDDARSMELPRSPVEIHASDIDEQAIDMARRNALSAGVEKDLRFDIAPFEKAHRPEGKPLVILNPPYNERMPLERAGAVHRRIGDVLKRHFAPCRAAMLTGAPDAGKEIGLRPTRRHIVFNSALECRFLIYDVRPIERADDKGGSSMVALADRASSSRAMFENRLRRMAKHWAKWARRQGITCYRLYHRDLPEIPLAIDWFEGWIHVAEFDRPHERTDQEQEIWRRELRRSIAVTLGVDPKRVFFKTRRPRTRERQYERQADKGTEVIVHEGGLKFLVNMSDYIDVGLFLDHRQTRSLVRADAKDRRVLNLFGYTGSFSVYAAAGGARSVTTVDLAPARLRWAERNFELNGLLSDRHEFIASDAMSFLENRPKRPRFDLAVVDPPTYSNSKRTVADWDVVRDHGRLLKALVPLMSAGGKIYFSTNAQRFRLEVGELPFVDARDLSSKTIPPDFQRKRPHRAWLLTCP